MFSSSSRRKRLNPRRIRLEAFEDRLAPAVVGGTVFLDANADGIRQNTEAGMAGVRVYIDANNNGKFDAPSATSPGDPSALSAPDGKYLIQLAQNSGTVTVAQVVPAGFVQTAGPSGPITLNPAGTLTPGPTFGNAPNVPPPPPTGGVIRGSVFVDANGDGIRQSTEVGQGGVTVFLDLNADGKLTPASTTNAGEPFVVTGPNGNYEMKVGKDGTYIVLEVVPQGWTQTTGTPAPAVVIGGQIVNGPVFGNQPPPPPPPTGGLIRGSVFIDLNGDGIRQSAEIGQGGVTVFLDLNNDGKLTPGTTGTVGEPFVVTGPDGNYEMKVGKDGTYIVLEIVPPGWTQTTGTPAPAVVIGGQIVNGPVFGNQPPPPPPPPTTGGLIRGGVFVDGNGDGIRQATEPGQAGVTVFLDLNGDGKLTPPTATTPGEPFVVTGPNGNYELKVAKDGTYSVLEVVPLGWTMTTGAPAPVTVAGGAVSLGPIFGNRPLFNVLPGRVEGRVFYDKNADGKLDLGEPGVPFIRVYSDVNGNSKYDPGEPSMLSDWAGRYRLVLPAGQHALRQVVPPGAVQTASPGTVTIVSGQTIANANFGLALAAPLPVAPKPANPLIAIAAGSSSFASEDDVVFLGAIVV